MVAQKPQGLGQGLPRNNEQIARCLDEVAELLEAQGTNVYRVRPYRTCGQTIPWSLTRSTT
jgi:DNA polymerase/3'-5' exonuclease PolX